MSPRALKTNPEARRISSRVTEPARAGSGQVRVSVGQIKAGKHPDAIEISRKEQERIARVSQINRIHLHHKKPSEFVRNLDALCSGLQEEQELRVDLSTEEMRRRMGELPKHTYKFFDDLFTYKGPIDDDWSKVESWLEIVFSESSLQEQGHESLIKDLSEPRSKNSYK